MFKACALMSNLAQTLTELQAGLLLVMSSDDLNIPVDVLPMMNLKVVSVLFCFQKSLQAPWNLKFLKLLDSFC